jgi:sodium transport system permease protein
LNWRDVRVLYIRELRAALRERTIVFNSILIPVFLYPVLMWVMFTGISFVTGTTEGMISRVEIASVPPAHAHLKATLAEHEAVELITDQSDDTISRPSAVDRLSDGTLDATLEISMVADASSKLANYTAEIAYDGSKDRSVAARDRLERILREYRADWLGQVASDTGIAEAQWQMFAIERDNRASSEEMGAFLMSLILPLFLIIMVALGSFYPAVDATAGERERSTWETLMTTAASRGSVVTAKYLYVATFGAVAALLNLTAMVVSMRAIFAPLMGEGDAVEFGIPLSAVPLVALGCILLALFAAAGMMLLASFARTFKEGQSLVTPFYLVLFVPMLLLQSPDAELTPTLAWVPIANLMLLFKGALVGSFEPLLTVITFVVSAVLVVAVLWLANRVLQFEDVMIGSYEGNLPQLIRKRLLGSKRDAATGGN